jgi:chemotaxis protein MotB
MSPKPGGGGGGGHQPVIIIKKQPHGKHGHHGGAWKVAYADFVTAMMAFFLVMWLVGQSAEVKAGVAGYFRDPAAFEGGRGVLPGSESGTTGGGAPMGTDVEAARATLEAAASRIREALSSLPDFEHLKDQVEITVTEEGLRIEMRESPDDGFFDSGSSKVKPPTVAMLKVIAKQLGELPNPVAVEGHTDSLPYSTEKYGLGYSNWELSADRANAARRILEGNGLRERQLDAVRGFADTRLRKPDQPMDAGNRRISIVVRRV